MCINGQNSDMARLGRLLTNDPEEMGTVRRALVQGLTPGVLQV